MKGTLFFLRYASKSHKKFIVLKMLETLLTALFPVILVYFPKYILDAAIAGSQNMALSILALYIALYIIFHAVEKYLSYVNNIEKSHLFADFQVDVASRIIDADLGQLESNSFIEQKNRANKYIYADGMGFGYLFDSVLAAVSKCITAFGYIIIIFKLNPVLVVLNIIITIIMVKVEGNIKRKEKKDNDDRIKHERRTSYYTEICSNHKCVKDIRIFNYKSSLLEQMKFHYNENISFYKRINQRHLVGEVLSILFFVIQLLVGYVFVIRLLISGSISAGDFTLNISTLTLFTEIVSEIMNKLVFVFSYDMYFNDFKQYMDIPNMYSKSIAQSDVPKESLKFEFKNVSFKYAGSETYALKNVSLCFGEKDHIAIVGENGSGKSTLVKLLLRLYDPTEGQILLNGKDIRSYDYSQYISLFSSVFQDYALFASTIEENITMDGKKHIDSNFKNRLRSIGLLAKVFNQYPNGFQTSVYKIFDDSGIEPSGGEGQQIAIARSLFKLSKVNILDEPTSALDPKIEFDLYQKYDALTNGNLSLFISHRLGSCKFANRIIVMHRGEVAEDGVHDELVHNDGMYSSMFRHQASLYHIEV